MALARLIATSTRMLVSLSANPDPQSPEDPALRHAQRNRHIFPAGFGRSREAKIPPIEFTPWQLEDTFTTNKEYVKDIYVTSAAYCKESKSPKHEFILVEVEAARDVHFRNYLILDRISNLPSDRITQHLIQIIAPVSSSRAPARDRIRISYDGTLRSLLAHSSISKYDVLERYDFHSVSFLLYQLVVLSRVVSDRHIVYDALSTQCYWYASLIWGCIQRLRPEHAVATINSKYRGRFGPMFHQQVDSNQIGSILKEAEEAIDHLRTCLEVSNKRYNHVTKATGVREELSRELEASRMAVGMPSGAPLGIEAAPPYHMIS
ncbi:Vegetative incompatibility protein HET-E-1 [Ceratobasidium sp. AG-Ba]|nr:Vegetative incompatibility protein HET-E-1 [Ceratobasidium sp. AG-Ba]